MTVSPTRPSASGLEAVFLEMRPLLLRRARAMGFGDDAEDVVQDVWLRIRAHEGPVASPSAYLHRMVYTAALDRRRGARRARTRDTVWAEDIGDGDGDGVAPEAERRMMALQALAAVEARLQALGDPPAMIFRRHRIGGEAQRDIARDLGMGLSTVEKHLRAAYAALVTLKSSDDEA